MVLRLVLGCASPPTRPPAVQEVPIGTEVGNSPEVPDASPNDPSSSDSLDARDAGSSSPNETRPADTPNRKHRGGHDGKPTAIGPSSGSAPEDAPADVAGGDRAALETKVFAGQGSRAETVTLVKLCTKEKDRACLQKIGAAMRKR